MKITAISPQTRNKDRVNVSVDGKYRFSLDIYQLSDLKIKVGQEYSEKDIKNLEDESQFGKVYGRALEYCLMRPRSAREVRDYLYRKTMTVRTRTGEKRPGVSTLTTARVFDRLADKGYINDENFARHWIENRHNLKGISRRKLTAELKLKGVDSEIIERLIPASGRNDGIEIQKVITKKRSRYPDNQKLMAYLARQGFSYDDIKSALSGDE